MCKNLTRILIIRWPTYPWKQPGGSWRMFSRSSVRSRNVSFSNLRRGRRAISVLLLLQWVGIAKLLRWESCTCVVFCNDWWRLKRPKTLNKFSNPPRKERILNWEEISWNWLWSLTRKTGTRKSQQRRWMLPVSLKIRWRLKLTQPLFYVSFQARLVVRNLSFKADEDTLQNIFSKHGQVGGLEFHLG